MLGLGACKVHALQPTFDVGDDVEGDTMAKLLAQYKARYDFNKVGRIRTCVQFPWEERRITQDMPRVRELALMWHGTTEWELSPGMLPKIQRIQRRRYVHLAFDCRRLKH
jgi:hypothetical protein